MLIQPNPPTSTDFVTLRIPPGDLPQRSPGPSGRANSSRSVRALPGATSRRGDRTLAPAHGAGLLRPERPAAALRAILDPFEHSQQLANPADEQPLLVHLHPRPRRSGEHDVISAPDRHLHADVIPPIKPGSDREHDSVLRRRLIGSRRHEQAGAPDPIRVQLLDHDAVEEWSKLISHALLWRLCRL
jgi:hypothetical protein